VEVEPTARALILTLAAAAFVVQETHDSAAIHSRN